MLRQQSPNSEVMLAGHSSGGGLALKYAGSSKPSFDRYILLAPFFGYKAPTVREHSGGWVQVSTRRYIGLSMLNNVGLSFLNAMPVMFFNRPDEYNDNFQIDNYSYRLNQSFSPENYAADLQKNKQPLLVLVGKNDEAFYADKFAPELNKYADKAKLYLLEGVHHLDLTSQNRTAEIMAVWISRQ